MAESVADELDELASQQIARIEQRLPKDPIARCVLFIEATRVADALTVNPAREDPTGYSSINNSIVQWGWNVAAALLLSPLRAPGEFPLSESTPESRTSAHTLLKMLGCNVLLRRGTEMLRGNLLAGRKVEAGFLLESNDRAMTTLLLDNLDPGLLEEAESKLNAGHQAVWDQWRCEDIDDLMLPLLRPWPTSRGVMVAYDAVPEVDGHFLAEALELATEWKQEAGIHDATYLSGVSGSELMAFATFFASFHLKHAKFVSLAAKTYPEVSPVQSLTIWKPREEFVADLAEYTGLDRVRVEAIVSAIALRADEAVMLRDETTPLRPLLIDLGNGLDLWPVSALGRNPFETIRRMQVRRDPSAIAKLSAPREAWLRGDLYALFEGSRYERVEGNIKVKVDGRILTDIDAAVYDRTADELALFQIKWQDFATNSPKELKSKASNFMAAMEAWTDVVSNWHKHIGTPRLLQKLRLRPIAGGSQTKIFLFGISRSVARLGAMAGRPRPNELALANWAQFVRARLEIGPADQVLSTLHGRLISEYETVPNLIPMPVTLEVNDRHIEFRDVFFRTEDE